MAALKAFVPAYMSPVAESFVTRTTLKYLQILKTYNPAAQRGAALALGALPYDLLAPVWRDVVDTLCFALALKVLTHLTLRLPNISQHCHGCELSTCPSHAF